MNTVNLIRPACITCGLSKSLNKAKRCQGCQVTRNKEGKLQWGRDHREEVNAKHRAAYPARKEKTRQYYQANKDRISTKRIMRYGITTEQYSEILLKQESKCAICGSDKPGGMGAWHIDHDHVSGKVRGLLCSVCNLGIGYLKDSVEILKKAITYLESGGT